MYLLSGCPVITQAQSTIYLKTILFVNAQVHSPVNALVLSTDILCMYTQLSMLHRKEWQGTVYITVECVSFHRADKHMPLYMLSYGDIHTSNTVNPLGYLEGISGEYQSSELSLN